MFFIILIVFCSCFRKHESDSAIKISQLNKPVYFVSVPFTKLSPIRSPCLDVEIEGKVFSMELDLGLQGDLAIEKELINQISEKTLLRTKPMYGIRGKEYLTNFYRIPKMQIGVMHFNGPFLQEDTTQEFVKDGTFIQSGRERSPRDPGRLGWSLFYDVNLLVDVKNSEIAFCDSLDTLKKRGYPVEAFTKCPLELERGLLEFQAETPKGKLRCLLDTGTTCNMFNSEIADGKTLDQMIWEPENWLNCDFFKIEGNDFGPITFHRVPIHIPMIEAVIGMEFIEDHLIFIDFANKLIYFAKNTDN